jgi:SAM-dependent methyltransferase
MTQRYDDELLGSLRSTYDANAAERDAMVRPPWRFAERAAFLDRLRAAGATRLLEVGAGTGQDSAYFRDAGLGVVATDLSPEMVRRCQAKGLEAYVMDFLHLDFPPASFDAVFAVNCLLHVPNADLPAVLASMAAPLRPGGLAYLGAHGGDGSEGIWDRDEQVPKRFYSWRTPEQLRAFAEPLFDVVDLHSIVVNVGGHVFHSLTVALKGDA